MSNQKNVDGFHIRNFLNANMEAFKKAEAAEIPFITGLTTGLFSMDEITMGLHNSDLVVLAGYSNSGKTTLAYNIARNLAVDKGVPTLIFNAESTNEQLSLRILKSEARVENNPFPGRKLGPKIWDRLKSASRTLSKAPLYLDGSPLISIEYIEKKAPVLVKQYGIKLIIIDYFQMIKGAYSQPEKAARSLKHLAMDLDIPIMVLLRIEEDDIEDDIDDMDICPPPSFDVFAYGTFSHFGDLIILVHKDLSISNIEKFEKLRVDVFVLRNKMGPTGKIAMHYDTFHGIFYQYSFEY